MDATPRRAFVLWRQQKDDQFLLCLSPQVREVEAAKAALAGPDKVEELMNSGEFPVITLNESGDFLLECADGVTTVREIAVSFARRYRIERSEATEVVTECLGAMAAAGLVDEQWSPL